MGLGKPVHYPGILGYSRKIIVPVPSLVLRIKTPYATRLGGFKFWGILSPKTLPLALNSYPLTPSRTNYAPLAPQIGPICPFSP
jgi:hypothetical protein